MSLLYTLTLKSEDTREGYEWVGSETVRRNDVHTRYPVVTVVVAPRVNGKILNMKIINRHRSLSRDRVNKRVKIIPHSMYFK